MSSVARGESSDTPRNPQKMTPADLANRGILQILWRRQLILLLSVVVCVATAIVYITQATPIFASASRISIDNQTPAILTTLLATGTTGQNYLFTQCEVIMSSPTVSEALKQPGILQLPSLANVENPVAHIRKYLTAGVGRNSDIIAVSYESPYAQDCAAVVNAVVSAYISSQNEKRVTTATGILKILNDSYTSYDIQRANLNKQIGEYLEKNPDISMTAGEKGNVVLQKLSTLTDAIVKEDLAAIDAKSSWDAAKALISDPNRVQQFIQLRREQSGSSGSRSDSELEDLAIRQEILKARGYQADARMMIELTIQMDAIRDRVKAAEKRYVESYIAVMEQNYLAAQSKVNNLNEQHARSFEDAKAVGIGMQHLKTMFDDRERINKFLDNLDSKIKDVNVTKQDEVNVNIQILETARADTGPIRPKKLQVLGISVVLGLMMGFGAALLQDWMDQRLRSVDEISAALQLPVLGVVPHIQGGKTAMARGMEVHVEPMSEVSEAYRTIRTAVYFGVPEGQDNTVLVTSPAPGDGKTTMASNLAIAMAQAGHTVLLIDCDFRRPRQHRIFGLKDDVGLSSVLAGDHQLDQAIQATAVPNMSLLPCGPIPSNPSEILNSQVFADTIDELKAKFDHVVIDSPPVNPVTDARILAASADVTIIVVRADKSTRKLAENAKESLLGVGANILGVVVNDAPRSGRGYGGYGYGYYSDRLYRDRTKSRGGNKTPANGEKAPTRL